MSLPVNDFPCAFIHIDGDSFFASVEMAHNPSLIDKAVVTGYERGVATSMSAAAKELGIPRGMPISEVQRRFPSVVVVAGDYKTYELYARRMYAIVRRYTGSVEEYSIDECFADITDSLNAHHHSYADIAQAIKSDLQRELGVIYSVGVAPTKVLAKVASKLGKPNGLFVIPYSQARALTDHVPCERVWGLGPASCEKLESYGVRTIGQFVDMPAAIVRRLLAKPGSELQVELQGSSVLAINAVRRTPQSIEHTHTFSRSTNNREYLWKELVLYTEQLCTQLRKYDLAASSVSLLLRSRTDYSETDIVLERHECVPEMFLTRMRESFDAMYDPAELYTRVRVRLQKVQQRAELAGDLFGSSKIATRLEDLHSVTDKMNIRYGKNCIVSADRLLAVGESVAQLRGGHRSVGLWRESSNNSRYISIPFLGEAH